MLDRQSLIVGYDPGRGEPRKKGKRINGDNVGDCVDCNQCVVVCPTGIDIRDGLQMECINCTQCIDACDNVMDRVGKPRGLIRFSSQDGLAGKANKLVRPRTLIYPAILAIVFGGLAYAINDKSGFDARVIRGKGAPFTRLGDGQVSNPMNLRLVNRTDIDQLYSLEITSPDSAVLEVIDLDALQLKPGQSVLVPLQIRFPSSLTTGKGNASMVLSVTDQSDNQRSVDFKMLGPR
jgi:cytochrome c oxidase accessory protein FixG